MANILFGKKAVWQKLNSIIEITRIRSKSIAIYRTFTFISASKQVKHDYVNGLRMYVGHWERLAMAAAAEY